MSDLMFGWTDLNDGGGYRIISTILLPTDGLTDADLAGLAFTLWEIEQLTEAGDE